MTTPTTPTRPPAGPTKPAPSTKSELSRWAATHKGQAGLLAAGAGVAGLALYRKRKAATTPAAAPALSTATGTDTASGAAAGYDSTVSDLYDAIEPMLESMQNEINALSTTPATGVAGADPVTAGSSSGGSTGSAAPMPTAPTPTVTPSATNWSVPVDSPGNDVAYNAQTGGSIALFGPGQSGSYANLPPGWSVATINSQIPAVGGGYLKQGSYGVPPGASPNPDFSTPPYTAATIPGWKFLAPLP